ncbi:proline-rich receptor-like protein kinase PERK2 [Dioscorea cayenensis subsp. rotundata]|uniref:Proline-rich receptor-like protein kinase PERK2 n=1 Tax=Dioscorea cayennensis subsp. rotundata TaxID=55577 RepID=A0AB40AMU0_DIOCR|nr:proline-rich receptor-like protein kinase PERK2 [Dioscorea cayenensis subsp. rotundata]
MITRDLSLLFECVLPIALGLPASSRCSASTASRPSALSHSSAVCLPTPGRAAFLPARSALPHFRPLSRLLCFHSPLPVPRLPAPLYLPPPATSLPLPAFPPPPRLILATALLSTAPCPYPWPLLCSHHSLAALPPTPAAAPVPLSRVSTSSACLPPAPRLASPLTPGLLLPARPAPSPPGRLPSRLLPLLVLCLPAPARLTASQPPSASPLAAISI